jgi:hypothetical protein
MGRLFDLRSLWQMYVRPFINLFNAITDEPPDWDCGEADQHGTSRGVQREEQYRKSLDFIFGRKGEIAGQQRPEQKQKDKEHKPPRFILEP